MARSKLKAHVVLFFCWFDLPRVAFVGVEGFCVTEGCSVSEPGLVGDTDKSNLTEIWYIWCSTYIYNIYIGSLIFQRRSFSRKWKRARREFGNVCFLFGSNDYGIPRFFAESLITDSCKCHARCLLRCDAKVAGQRKIRGDIGLGNFNWAKVSRLWGEGLSFTFPLPWLSNHTVTEKCYSSMLELLFLPRVLDTRFC